MTDEENQFIESLMQQIEQASQEKRGILNDKLVRLDQSLVQADLHISDLIETIIHRTRKREENTIEQLEELRTLVTHRGQAFATLPPADNETARLARRYAPETDSIRNVVEDSYDWANDRVN